MAQNYPSLKIIKFVDGIFLPPLDGASERFCRVAYYLQRLGVEVVVIHCYRKWSSLNQIKQQGYKTYAIAPKYYYQDLSLIKKIINKEKPNIIEMNDVELITSVGASLNREFRIPVIFDCQYVLTTLLQDLAAKSSLIKRVYLLERKLSKIVSGVICFTERQRELLEKVSGIDRQRIAVIPIGANTEEIIPVSLSDQCQDVLFLGNLYYEPNQKAVEVIANKIAPSLLKEHPSVRFKIVGDCPKSLISTHSNKNLVFTGRIPNINEVFKGVRLGIAPVRVGGGMRVKTLTYMAAGIPIVAFRAGVEGIRHHGLIMVSNNLSKFCKYISNLLNDLNEAQRLGRELRKVCEQEYNWWVIASRCRQLYLKALTGTVCYADKGTELKIQPFWLKEAIDKGRFKQYKLREQRYYLLQDNKISRKDV